MSTPAQIGRYHVVGHLASGGMAEIFLGKLVGPSGFERPVVIKRILPNLVRQSAFVEMFLDEARVISRIHHPNVVHVQELGTEGDELFLVMEYLEGETALSVARRAVTTGIALDRGLAAHIVAEACAGLHAAHELKNDEGEPLGLVHRDVSPSNVFITYGGAVKLLDFGIAKFAERQTDTEAGLLKGKFAYMSPEQCMALKLDRRSDVFALGILLFELSTGKRLFARPTSLLTMKAITEEGAPSPLRSDPDYPAALARVCEKALQREAADRYPSAAAMRLDLMKCVRQLTPDAVPEMALAEAMTRLFPDRIAAKAELVRRVSAGSNITNVPVAEVDVSVELPTVTGSSAIATPLATEVPGAAPKRPPMALLAMVALVGVGVVVGAGVALLSGSGDAPAPVAEASRVGDEAPSAMAAPPVGEAAPAVPSIAAPSIAAPSIATPSIATPSIATPSIATVSADVTVHVSSEPSGADILVDGARVGTTPAILTLPRGAAPLALRVEHRGFTPYVAELLPSEDRQLAVELVRGRAGGRRSPAAQRAVAPSASTSASTPAPSPSASPFRRFN